MTELGDVVRLDPDGRRELAVVAELPAEPVTNLEVVVRAGRPLFVFDADVDGRSGVYIVDLRRGPSPRLVATVRHLRGPS